MTSNIQIQNEGSEHKQDTLEHEGNVEIKFKYTLPAITKTNNKTKYCKNIEIHGKCTRSNCGFYHNEKERKIQLCKFNLNCRNFQNCEFYHENEDIKKYFDRTAGVAECIFPKYIYGDKENCVKLINKAILDGYKKIIFITQDIA